jgi:hypothetical protein
MATEKMTAGKAIEQLQELKLHCESMTEGDDNWARDIEALNYTIRAIVIGVKSGWLT